MRVEGLGLGWVRVQGLGLRIYPDPKKGAKGTTGRPYLGRLPYIGVGVQGPTRDRKVKTLNLGSVLFTHPRHRACRYNPLPCTFPPPPPTQNAALNPP